MEKETKEHVRKLGGSVTIGWEPESGGGRVDSFQYCGEDLFYKMREFIDEIEDNFFNREATLSDTSDKIGEK